MSNDKEYELIQGDVCVAGTSGENAYAEIKHYAFMYGQDGPVEIYEVMRRKIYPESLATPPVASGALPELPYEDYIEGHHGDLARGYTADQMRAYGQACHAVGRGAAVREYIDNGSFAAAAAPNAALVAALKMALRQNECDMVMTGEECRKCSAALAQAGAA